MIIPSPDNCAIGRYYVFISNNTGTDFIGVPSILNGMEYSEYFKYWYLFHYYLTDLDGDGRTDFLCTSQPSGDFTSGKCAWTGYKTYKTPVGKTAPLLEKVANGLNHLTTIAYTKLSQAPSTVYQLGSTTPSFPVFNFQGAMPVVSSATMDNGTGSTSSFTYYYEGAKIHQQGKGFLGFSKMSVTDATAGIISETQSDYNTTYFSPLSGTVTKKTTDSTTIETTTSTYTQKVLDSNSKRIFPYVQSTTQTNNLTGHSVTTSISSVDNYGNATKVVKSYNNGVTETTINDYASFINTTDWLVGRLGSSTVTNSKSGETSVSHSIRYTYYIDGITKPDFIYYNEGTSLEYAQNYDYDSKGNNVQIYQNGTSIGESHTNFTFDTDGIRVLTATDVLGHVNTNTYDSYGQLQTEKDYLNNTNTYGYDALGRKVSVSQSTGCQSTTTFVWTGSNKPALAVYGVTQTGNDGSVSTAWYDKLGRPIRTEKKGFNGSMILTDTEYNTKGQVYRVSDPYFSGVIPWAETYETYDNFGRITAVNRNTGRNSTFSYLNNKITETTIGKTNPTWKEYDSQGLVTKAHDEGGDIVYAYFPDGKLKSTTASGVETSMLYADAARNQTKLTDPSAGVINYTYDSFGRVLTMTNALNKVTTYKYLADGRIDNVINPEGTTVHG